MNMFKRFLAMSLVLCMVLGFTPANTFAAEETGADSGTVETIAPEAEAPVREETPAEAPPSVQEEAPAPDAELLALPKKPADGTSAGNPFAPKTGGSQNFRIPGIVTLDNGRLVASADARWNKAWDGGGLDTIVSVSDDNGQNWHYTFANYLGDNGNVYNSKSTAFIDPAIATDGRTIYMIADLFPAGIALNGESGRKDPQTGSTGFDNAGNLLLSKGSSGNYNFYLKNGAIYKVSDNSVVTGYTVDAHFNIKGTNPNINNGKQVNTNLFCADSPFKPFPTNYLYLTTSTDGQTWSAPQLLNLKKADEQTFLVGPGNGTYDAASGRVIFTAYNHTGGNVERTSLIWKDSNGWHRSAEEATTSGSRKSSEATPVVLKDGTVRVFYRGDLAKLEYTDYAWQDGAYVRKDMEQIVAVNRTPNNQMSAIKYSRLYDGKELILVSTATNTDIRNRSNGHIYAFTVEADKSMKLVGDYDVVPNQVEGFDYSCLTEDKNGDIAYLYESDVSTTVGKIEFQTIPIENIVTFPANTVTDSTGISASAPDLTGITVTSKAAAAVVGYDQSASYEISLTNSEGAYTGPATVQIPVMRDCKGYAVKTADGKLTAVTPDTTGSITVKANSFPTTITVYGNTKYAKTEEVNVLVGGTVTRTQSGLSQALTERDITNNGSHIVGVNIQSTSRTEGGKTEHTVGAKANLASLQDGQSMQVIIASGQNMLVSNGAGKFANATKADKVDANAVWTITKNGEFYKISQQIDGVTYYLYRSEEKSSVGFGTTTYSYDLQVNQHTDPRWRYNGGFYQNLKASTEFKWGSSKTNYADFYLTPSWSIYNAKSTVDVYSVTSQEVGGDTVYDHSITFTGKTVGDTTVLIGDVLYNVHVTQPVTKEETPFTAGTGVGIGGPVTKLTVSQGLPYDLNLKEGMAGTKWRIGDENIASVDQNGKVTGLKPGETRVYVTIGNVEHSIPVVVLPNLGGNLYDFYASEITNTTVYYIWNNDAKLVEMIEGEAIYVRQNGQINCCNFFGAPYQGYALTRMTATNTKGEYYRLHQNKQPDKTQQGFMGATVGQTQIGEASWGEAKVLASVQTAINAGCDGAMGFTRVNSSADTTCSLTFRSEKLPTIEKAVHGVLGTDKTYRPYTEGMTAIVGETVYYKITVQKYESIDSVTYNNAFLKDVMDGGKDVTLFKGKDSRPDTSAGMDNPRDITSEFQADKLSAGTHVFYASHVITDADLDTTLVNNAELTYNYKSQYSAGAFDASAKAEAKITATSFVPKDIVIDFGLPVTVHYDAWGKENVVLSQTGHTANYGTVSVSGDRNKGWDVTYTPTKVMQGVDTVTLKGTNGAEYSFKVYPATTVLYEEGFASLTGFTGGSKGNGKQETQLAGADGTNFGFTSAYNKVGMSNGTQIESAKLLSTASFTFTGTGMDLYANCNETSGAVSVTIMKDGKFIKYYQVDTAMVKGDTDVTGQQAGAAYSLPIVSVRDLPHGTYNVEVQHIAKVAGDTSHVMLDGFRVYNTLNDLENAAYPASEKNPGFTELRDVVLTGLLAQDSTTGKDLVDQVFTQVDTKQGAVVLANGTQYTQDNVNDLLNNGPKNELFLYPNQAVTFKLADGVKAQIGLKAVNDTVTYAMHNGTNANTQHTISTSTDMFYHELSGEVIITNKSNKNILSVTLVKHFGSAANAFAEVTEQQMARALFSLGYQDPTALADATLNVSLVDWSGKEIAAQSIAANGLKGDAHTFTAEEIRTVVSQLLPAGYALVDDSAVADTSVIYGENGQVKIQIGQTATLQVSYVKRVLDLSNIFHGSIFTETVVGTAEFSAVQTDSNGSMTVSADELRKDAPEGYRLGRSVRAQSVPFGTEKALKLIVR